MYRRVTKEGKVITLKVGDIVTKDYIEYPMGEIRAIFCTKHKTPGETILVVENSKGDIHNYYARLMKKYD